jgi:hypothetical protein
MISNSIITAGWLFFAGWSAVLSTLAVIAFGRDLLPLKVPNDSSRNSASDSRPHPTTR